MNIAKTFTPNAVISPRATYCQEKNEVLRKIFAFSREAAAFFLREKHIARLFSSTLTIFPVKCHVIREHVVSGCEAQSLSRSIDRGRRPLQLQKNADGCLVQLDQQPLGPGVRCEQAKRFSERFVLEPT